MLYSITGGVTSFRVDGATIEAIVDGSGDAIVLIHGFPFTSAIWKEQIPQLSQRRRVIALDLRGCGASSVSDGPYLMELLAADVAQILDQLSCERAILVGHSMGGYVSMAFARMFSERVERLALVCSRLSADDEKTAQNRNILADRIEGEASVEPVIEAYFPKLFAGSTSMEHPQIVEAARTIARTNSPVGAAWMLRGIAQRAPSFDIAEELSMPVLVVAGGSDQIVSSQEARATSAAFPNARLEICERSGHLPMMEEPDRLAGLLRDFCGPG